MAGSGRTIRSARMTSLTATLPQPYAKIIGSFFPGGVNNSVRFRIKSGLSKGDACNIEGFDFFNQLKIKEIFFARKT